MEGYHGMRALQMIACVLLLVSGRAAGQGYPEKTVVVIAPFPGGGPVEMVKWGKVVKAAGVNPE